MIAVIFDTETTGLIENPARSLDKQPEIISIAIQKLNLQTGEFFEKHYFIFKPTKPVSELITKITGFTNEYLNNMPLITDYMEEIILVLESAPLIIGQNINFDMSMVNLECRRYHREIKWPKSLDLIENTIHLKGYRLSLTNLHLELFGVTFPDAHQADVDVAMTAKCAIELFKRGML